MLLIRKLDRRLDLLDAVAQAFADPRDPQRVTHTLSDLLCQRVFGMVQGYEDLNDHAAVRIVLRGDSGFCRDRMLRWCERYDVGYYIVTNLDGDTRGLYEDLYCARGEMENRIKEAQLGLFADRTRCHYFAANQFRLLLSSLAYILIERLRARHHVDLLECCPRHVDKQRG